LLSFEFGAGAGHFGSGFFGCEHQFDFCAALVALALPGGDFGDELVTLFDPSVETNGITSASITITHIQETIPGER